MREPVLSLNAAQLLANEGFVRRLARSLARDEARADDLVQETWLAALERTPPRDRSGLRAWLARVVRNRAAMGLRGADRRKQRERASARPERTPTTLEILERVELHERLVSSVLRLSEAQRDVVLRRYFAGESVQEIAAALGVPAATVSSRLRRGLICLRRELGVRLGEPRGHGLALFGWLEALRTGFDGSSCWAPAARMTQELLMKKTFLSTPVLLSGVLGAGIGYGGAEWLGEAQDDAPRATGAAELQRPLSGRATAEPAPWAPVGSATPARMEVEHGAPPSAAEPELDLAAKANAFPLSGERLEQVLAIQRLLDEGTPAAYDALLDSFMSSDDPILVALLEEALLDSELDVAQTMMLAFGAAEDPQRTARMAAILAKLAQRQPSLGPAVVDLFVDAFSKPGASSESLLPVRRALISMGAGALEPVASFLADASSNPGATDTAAWVLSQAAGDRPDLAREQVGNALAALLAAGGDTALTEEQRGALRDKTQWLAWSAVNRPAAEHDQLAAVLAAHLFESVDKIQAQSVAWGIANMRGLSEEARQRTAADLLGALHRSDDPAIRQSFVWAVRHLASAGYDHLPDAAFDEILRRTQDAWTLHQGDPRLAAPLQWLLVELEQVQHDAGG